MSQLTKNLYAQRGDLIAITGELGSTTCALNNNNTGHDNGLDGSDEHVKVAQQVSHFAHACIDIANGLLTDLENICQASGLGADIVLEHIPVNKAIKDASPQWSESVLTKGNDCQLCFTFAATDLIKIPKNCSVIGQMRCGDAVSVFVNNEQITHKKKGFLHFNRIKS